MLRQLQGVPYGTDLFVVGFLRCEGKIRQNVAKIKNQIIIYKMLS